MPTVAVWHGSVADAVRFANEDSVGRHLVALVPDIEMRHALWGFYRVTPEAYQRIVSTPRLTYKGMD